MPRRKPAPASYLNVESPPDSENNETTRWAYSQFEQVAAANVILQETIEDLQEAPTPEVPTAAEVSFDPAATQYVGTDVQAALEETDTRIEATKTYTDDAVQVLDIDLQDQIDVNVQAITDIQNMPGMTPVGTATGSNFTSFRIDRDGNIPAAELPPGWTARKVGTGRYEIVHNVGRLLNPAILPIDSGVYGRVISLSSEDTSMFQWAVRNTDATLANTASTINVSY